MRQSNCSFITREHLSINSETRLGYLTYGADCRMYVIVVSDGRIHWNVHR